MADTAKPDVLLQRPAMNEEKLEARTIVTFQKMPKTEWRRRTRSSASIRGPTPRRSFSDSCSMLDRL